MNRGLLHSNRSQQLWTGTKVLGILAIGILLGIVAVLFTASIYKESFINAARTASQSINVQDVRSLTVSEADVDNPVYQDLKRQLAALRLLAKGSRFTYVMVERDGKVYFVADSEPAESEDYSPPGQEFSEASPAVTGVFKSGADAIDGPTRDRWGVWLSALVPLKDSKTGEVVALLGIDIPAKNYLTLIGLIGAFPVSVAIVAALVIGLVDMARRRRQEAVEMQAELVSVITHELNNPLTGIRWGAELLLSSYYQEGASANVTRAIYSSVRKLQDSVDDVLEIARLGRNITQITPEDVDMTALVKEIFDTQKLPADHKHVALTFATTWPTSGLIIKCDRSKLKRVFNNLVSNAIKYTREGTVVVVGYEHRDGFHRMFVQDAGIGIPKEEQQQVFAGFYRASNAIKSGEHGTGMGLFLVRKTMLQHGGDVELASEESKGTTVTITIPDVLPSQPKSK